MFVLRSCENLFTIYGDYLEFSKVPIFSLLYTYVYLHTILESGMKLH